MRHPVSTGAPGLALLPALPRRARSGAPPGPPPARRHAVAGTAASLTVPLSR